MLLSERRQRNRAILVAQDVLKRLKSLQLTRGYYMYGAVAHRPRDSELRDFLKREPNCHVCAMGACLLSYAHVYDNLPACAVIGPGAQGAAGRPRYSTSSKFIIKKLVGIYDVFQLALIESAFETRVMPVSDCERGSSSPWLDYPEARTNRNLLWELLQGAAVFGIRVRQRYFAALRSRYQTANHAVLAAIMRNVVAHDGTFHVRPVSEVVYEYYCKQEEVMDF